MSVLNNTVCLLQYVMAETVKAQVLQKLTDDNKKQKTKKYWKNYIAY